MSNTARTAVKRQIDRLHRSLNWHYLDDLAVWTVEQAVAIQQIPAPTFAETQRAAYVRQQFTELGLAEIDTDDMLNVYGLLRGTGSSEGAIMVSAHTDTVFPAETDLTIRRNGELIYGPGLGDNSMGVAGMLGLISAMQHEDIRPETDIWFVATSREEGLGDLGGIRAAYERLKDDIDCVVNIEGLSFGYIYHAGIAVRRLHITASTEGGHSWLHFGRPSAIHGLIDLGARINATKLSNTPRTTYNIGIIEGGQSVNSIATRAELWLDMRSVEQDALHALETAVRAHVNALTRPDMRFEVEVVGDRPAGAIATDHPLVQAAMKALQAVGVRGSLERGSTDGNIPLAAGCPTVTVGITRGGNAHRLDEYAETSPVARGLQQLILLVAALSKPSND